MRLLRHESPSSITREETIGHCRKNRGTRTVKGRRKTWLRKKEPFRWHFYSAINKELSPNPFLAKNQALHQRSVRLLSPA